MKGLLKIGARLLDSKVFKIADKALIGGAITNVREDTDSYPAGKPNYKKIIETALLSSIPIILLIMLAMGVITIEQLKELFKILG